MTSRLSLIGVAFVSCVSWMCSNTTTVRAQISPSPTATAAVPISESLKGKSDEELLRLVVGPPDKKAETALPADRVEFSPLDRLWEMAPRDAAIALLSDYVTKDVKGEVTFQIDDTGRPSPPLNGEIGLRWDSSSVPPAAGVTILRYDGDRSRFLISSVEFVGRTSESELERALAKTDAFPLRATVARQIYEILWWLRHAKMVGRPSSSSYGGSLGYSIRRFWMKPDGPVLNKVTFSEPRAEQINDESREVYAAFADTLLRRAIERSGIKRRYPSMTVGQADPDSKLLRARPEMNDPVAVRNWVGRMVDILRDPKRDYLHLNVLYLLVPMTDPLRYKDERIDAVLFDLFRRGSQSAAETKAAKDAKTKEAENVPSFLEADKKALVEYEKRQKVRDAKEASARHLQFDGSTAAELLGVHDCVKAFPELLEAAKKRPPVEIAGSLENEALLGAAALAGKHPELRPALVEFLRPQLSTLGASSKVPASLFAAIWRGDLRELTPELDKLANSTAGGSSKSPDHTARVILLAWRETDPLTKTKLDALLHGYWYVGHASWIPEVLRAEFQALSATDQLTFRTFVSWLRTVDAPWSRRQLENVFTPHTPRPNIAIEE